MYLISKYYYIKEFRKSILHFLILIVKKPNEFRKSTNKTITKKRIKLGDKANHFQGCITKPTKPVNREGQNDQFLLFLSKKH